MADIQKREYEVNVSYNANSETLIWSSANRNIPGKITCVAIDFEQHAINVDTMLARKSEIIVTSTHSSETKETGRYTAYCEKKKIDYTDFRKIYSSSNLANNGVCDVTIKIKADRNLSGSIKGTVTISFTEDEEEQNKETTLGLNQNALTDWLKESTASKAKKGAAKTNQYPIEITFEQSSNPLAQVLLWTNKGVNSDFIENVNISLNIDVRNNTDSMKVIQLDFNAAYGSDTFSDTINMWQIPAGELRNITTAASYNVEDIPNDGLAVATLVLKTNMGTSGLVEGVVILETKAAGTAVSNATGEATTDTSVQTILDMLNGEGYSVGGSTADTPIDVDSFMSAYSGSGYEDDTAMLLSDSYNNSAMTNRNLDRVSQLEQRVTELELRMSTLGVGGADIDWYDGGADGSDAWGIDEWYKQNESRINQQDDDSDIRFNLFSGSTTSQMENVFFTYTAESGKVIKRFDYTLMLSYKYTGEECIGNDFSLEFDDGSGNVLELLETVTFDDSNKIVTKEYSAVVPELKVSTIRGRFVSGTTLTQDQIQDLIDNCEGKISGNTSVTVTEASEQITQSANVDFNLFTDQSNLENKFYVVNPQATNKTIERVDYNFTFSYQYTGTACNGKKLTLYMLSKRYDGGSVDKNTTLSVTLDLSNKQFSKVVQGAIIREKDFLINNGNSELDFCLSDKEISDWSQAEKTDILNNFQGKIFGTVKYTLS